MALWRLVALVFLPWFASTPALASDTDRATRLSALAAFHDPSVPDAWTRLALKQSALDRVRRHLGDAGRESHLGPGWNVASDRWRVAERELVAVMIDAGARELGGEAWFRDTWRAETGAVLDDAQLDGVLTQFREAPGPHLAATMDGFIGEMVMSRLTFTDRIRMNTPGLEAEVVEVRRAVDEKLARVRFDYTAYPRAQLFIWHDPGRRYFREVGFRMITRLNARLDAALAAQEAAFVREAARIDPHVESFRQSLPERD